MLRRAEAARRAELLLIARFERIRARASARRARAFGIVRRFAAI
jgi:hypothetical protein